MAQEQVQFELVLPEKLLCSQSADMVVVPGEEGDFGVLPRHIAAISTLRTGVVSVYKGEELAEKFFVAGGFVEVTAERCAVLAEFALPVGEIDVAAVQRRLTNAREDLVDAEDISSGNAAKREIALSEAMLKAVS